MKHFALQRTNGLSNLIECDALNLEDMPFLLDLGAGTMTPRVTRAASFDTLASCSYATALAPRRSSAP
jgi:hypothetical protein